ncbi:MAG: cyclic nucleotide-binding domain-containing protein [Rhodospirillaceae bacterium]|nr:cyclic nucleotide-binding domain-containing protein [Rhodospirillaceae bacterium]
MAARKPASKPPAGKRIKTSRETPVRRTVLEAGPPELVIERFAKGQVLFHEGDFADRAFVIKSGAVGLSRRTRSGEQSHFLTLRDGEIVGEMALIVDIKRTATATAREDTEAIVIGRREFDFHLEKLNPFVLRILRVLVKRLKDTTDAYMEY